MPCKTYNVPRVVMNDGSLRNWVTNPLNTPIRAAMIRPMMRDNHNGSPSPPSPFRVTMITGMTAKVIPADRSISPQINRKVSPAAIRATALKKLAMFSKLLAVKNAGFDRPK
jgi:hypothetical protein